MNREYHDAVISHENDVNQLEVQNMKLNALERELELRRKLLNDTQRLVEHKRAHVIALGRTVEASQARRDELAALMEQRGQEEMTQALDEVCGK